MERLGLNQPKKIPAVRGLRHTPKERRVAGGNFVVMPSKLSGLSEEEARRWREKREQDIDKGRRGGKRGERGMAPTRRAATRGTRPGREEKKEKRGK